MPIMDDLPLASPPLGRAYRVYPNAVRARWVLPAASHLRRSGLGLYTPQTWKGLMLKGLLAVGWPPGELIYLNDTALSQLETELATMLGRPEVCLAFSMGTPGAYRKLTAQVMAADGQILAYAKMGREPLAKQSLAQERQNLARLDLIGGLKGRIPRILGWTEWLDYTVLVAEPGVGRPGPTAFGEMHLHFLQKLAESSFYITAFQQSPMWDRMLARYNSWRAEWPSAWGPRYSKALRIPEANLGVIQLPVSYAHRDFCPWNTRVSGNELFVFDWEAAEPGSTPFYDVFHFGAVSAALRGQSYRAINPMTRQFAKRSWPQGEEYLSDLYLAYLVDMSLFYGEARMRAPESGDDRVWTWLGTQIDENLEVRYGLA